MVVIAFLIAHTICIRLKLTVGQIEIGHALAPQSHMLPACDQ